MAQILPTELLQNVFMLLSPCTDYPSVLKVCRHWRDVCMDTIELRKNKVLSAFRLQSPLQWCTPKTVQSTLLSSTQSAPSKRFGSSVAVYRNKVYVFGGATRMFTSFNDLWVFDLRTLKWNRILCEGEPPAPRAHAKGGFINNLFYLFGGCKSFCGPGFYRNGHIEWLTDLNSFDPATSRWSRCHLGHVTDRRLEEPIVSAGQSGCFLPSGGPEEPSLLVLFGGSSHVTNVCVNSLCIISPEHGLWFSISQQQSGGSEEEILDQSAPSGRCGHSVCALDPRRMLVLFGNRQSPLIDEQCAPELSEHSSASPTSQDGSLRQRPVRGKPAGDIWILTRCRPETLQDWSTVTWFWTEIDCSSRVPNSPPLDFYYMGCVVLPNRKPVCASDMSTSTFTVVCISQATDQLLEEAGRQRRRFLQRIRINSEVLSPVITSPNFASASASSMSDMSGVPAILLATAQSSSEVQEMHALSPPSWLNYNGLLTSCDKPRDLASFKRAADRRARRLKALAAQERRLFGQRSSVIDSPPNDSGERDNQSPQEPTLPLHPMAVYTLEICLIGDGCGGSATWLAPRKLQYMDLVCGPQECLGSSVAYGYGCVFLFGGLFDSDEAFESPSNQTQQSQPKSGRLSSRASEPSQLFVLQPKALVGTIV